MSTVPPVYSDIAKASNDLLGKDYPVGSSKLEVNSTTSNGVKFTLVGTKDAKAVFNELKIKYTHKPLGLTITETLNTSSSANLQLEVLDTLAKGLKLDVNTSLISSKGGRFLKGGFEYKSAAGIATRASVDIFKGPFVSADAVLSKHGALIGAELGYDVGEAKLSKVNYAVGYVGSDYTVSLLCFNHCSSFSAAYHHRVSSVLEAGAKANWARADSNVGIEFGSKYVLDKDAFVKAKVDSAGKVGLGYTQTLRPGVKLAMGTLIDSTKMDDAASHKLGFQLTVEA